MTRTTLGAKCGGAPGTCWEPPIHDAQDAQDAPDTDVQMHHGVRVCVCVCGVGGWMGPRPHSWISSLRGCPTRVRTGPMGRGSRGSAPTSVSS